MQRTRPIALTAVALAATLTLGACGAAEPAADGEVRLSFLTPSDTTSVSLARAQIAAFQVLNPGIKIDLETYVAPGDTLIQTRLATGDMTDLFVDSAGLYRLPALNASETLLDLSGEDFMESLEGLYLDFVSDESGSYAVPFSPVNAHGIFYNRALYSELDLEIPHTWDEFFANAEALKDAGHTPFAESLGVPFTALMMFEGSFAAQMHDDPTWLERFNDGGKASYSEGPMFSAIEAIARLAEDGLVNADASTATNTDAFTDLVTGEVGMYAYFGSLIPAIKATNPDDLDGIGYFPVPDDDKDADPVTFNTGLAVYANGAVADDENRLAAVRKFLAFIVSPQGCEIMAAERLTGPFFQDDCVLPENVPAPIADIESYFNELAHVKHGGVSFVSASQPNSIAIMVEVASGFITAEEGAAKLDAETRMHAQQLGLDGW